MEKTDERQTVMKKERKSLRKETLVRWKERKMKEIRQKRTDER